MSERSDASRKLSRTSSALSSQSSTRATRALRKERKEVTKTLSEPAGPTKRSSSLPGRCLSEGVSRLGDNEERLDKWNSYARYYVNKEFPHGKFEPRDKWQDHVDDVIGDDDFLMRAEKSIPEEDGWRKSKHDPVKVNQKRMGCIGSKAKVVEGKEDDRVKAFSDGDDSNEDEDDKTYLVKIERGSKMVPSLPETLAEEDEEGYDDDDEDDDDDGNESDDHDDSENDKEEPEEEEKEEEEEEEEEEDRYKQEPTDIGTLITDILEDGKPAKQEPKNVDEDNDDMEDDSIKDVDAAIKEILNEGMEDEDEEKIDDVDAELQKMEEEEEKEKRKISADAGENNISHDDMPQKDEIDIQQRDEEYENIESTIPHTNVTDDESDKTSAMEEDICPPSPDRPASGKKHERPPNTKKYSVVTLPETVLNKVEADIVEENKQEEAEKEEERQKVDELIKELALE